MAEYAHPESLVSTEWVAQHGSDPNVRLIEVDVDTSAYEQGHISGAVGWRVNSGGMSVVFSGDTRFNPELVKASQGARLLIHEAYRTDEESDYANNHGHSTAGDAGRAATQAGVTELVLTHFDSEFAANPQPLLDDAKKHFDGPTSAATDLRQITVSAP